MPDATERPIRRILVALDASGHSFAALDVAVKLATHVGADLRGVFVEDIDLLRAAELPIAQEVSSFTSTTRRMTSLRMERVFRVQADRSRQALAMAIRSLRIQHTFEVTRGRVPGELLQVAAEADLLVLGQAGSSRSSRRKIGRTAQAVLDRARLPVLLVRPDQRQRVEGGMLTLYDGSAAAEEALRLAVSMTAGSHERQLTVLLLAHDAHTSRTWHHQLTERLGERLPRLHFRPLESGETTRLTAVAREEQGGVLIVPTPCAAISSHQQELLYAATMPVLFVPERAEPRDARSAA
jgi:nucleotide-binding universal stress UspA family protein